MDKLNKKMLEFAGFVEADIKKHYYWEYCGRYAKWIEPDSEYHVKPPSFLDPDIGIAHCFKWLVPKLKPLGLLSLEFHNSVIDKVLTPDEVWGYECHIKLEKYILDRFDGQAETPALALCLAIEKLIEEK